ncbi:hypothetical protein AB1Y20_006834 [Prymnesium parvum]|uniref:Uncharacterized protein n=1 Tax=Prymnesium parvum TaxID=97485 RepID=A0AB34J1T0_PRYPA
MVASLGPVPRRAREYYKAVAVLDGRMFSIFDGRTEYVLSRELYDPNGLWVCPDPLSVVSHARQQLPRRSVLYDAPRAIIRLLGWSALGYSPAAPEYGSMKLSVTNVLPIAVLPYSAASPLSPRSLPSSFFEAHQRPPSAGRRPRSAGMEVSAGLALRLYGGGEPHSARMQAQTIQLHEQVRQAQERLDAIRAIRLSTIENPAPWVQRAMHFASRSLHEI